MLESFYQAKLIKRLRREFDGSFILKNDSGYLQGVPDLTVLYRQAWALLEVKVSEKSPHEPNQDYYVEFLNSMSFSAFIYPENEDQIFEHLHELFDSHLN